jgi:hypothetical protein
MNMKRLILHVGTTLLSFMVGAVAATLWKSHHNRSQTPTVITQAVEAERPLTKQNVSRSLLSRSFRTDKLRKNSNDEIVWRWLKESIARYPQNWVKLNISDTETYSVVLDPPKELDTAELNYLNKELNEKGLASLIKGKRYLPIDVYQSNIICPSWSGFIDAEEARLVYFVGTSG